MMPNSEGSGNVVSIGDLGVGVHHGGGGGGDMNGGSVNDGNNGGESNLKKGPWTAEEDSVLVEYVRKHGEGNWNAVQRHSGLARCGKSCRLRWANHLRPNLKKGSFSPDEERLIVELHAKFGNKWARMASLLPGRTDNEIKNYWNTRVKRHQRQGLPLYPPDIQPQHPPSPHFHHHHHSPAISSGAMPMPTSSFTFQTQFPNSSPPITPTSAATPPPLSPATTSTSFPTLPLFDYSQPSPHHQFHHHHHHSTPSTPTSCFSFPTQQLHSPSTPPPISPLSSPSTNPNSSFPTLPLFDFNAHRTPPILQSPIRFKRFASNPDISNLHHHQSPDHMSNNFSLLSQMGNHHHHHQINHQLPNYSNYGGGDFHSELQKENQEMCSLLASVTQQQQSPELPSNQFLSGRNLGIGVNTTVNGSSNNKLGRRMNKRKYFKEKVNGKLEIALMEELLQECGNTNTNTEHHNHNSLINLQDHHHHQDQKPQKMFVSDHNFPPNWDLTFSSEKGEEEEEEMMNTTMAEDLQKVLNTYSIPTMQAGELYNSESADMSNGQSSVVTTDENNNNNNNVQYNHHDEMQQIASMFPAVVTEHDVRNLGSCAWDNLPGIC